MTFVHRSGTMVLPFLALYVTSGLGMDVRYAGIYLGAYGIGGALGALLGGRLADRLGNVRAMQLTLLGAGVGFGALGLIENPWLFGAALLVTGIAAEGFRTPSSAEIGAAAAPALRARAFSLRRLAINLGMTSGPAIGGVLATIDYAWLFAVDGATCIAAGVCAIIMLHPRTTPMPVPTTATAASDRADTPQALGADFVALLAAAGLVTLAFGQLFGTYPLTLKQDFGHPETVIGALLALNTLLIIAFEMILQHQLAGIAQPRVAAAGCGVLAIGFLLVPLDPRLQFLVLAMIVLTVGEMLLYPTIESHVVALAPHGALGPAMGRLHAVFSGMFVLAPVVGIAVYDALGYRALWIAAAGITALSACAFVLVDVGARSRRRARAPER